MTRVAVMGSGSFGTALGMITADAGGGVTMWARSEDVAESISRYHENPTYHPGVELPPSIWATTDPGEALRGAGVVILAVPAQSLRANLTQWRELIPSEAIVVSVIKGIEQGTNYRMSQVVAEIWGHEADQVAVVSGPNLARELAARQPAATTVACTSERNARAVAAALTTPYFRPYWTPDVVGAEIAGSAKNVIALANGMAYGMGFGENAQAALITRGLAEISRLGAALGARELTFLGLAGVGDLIATCTSPLSRNRTFGENLGRGLTMTETIERTRQTCEGVKSCRAIVSLATSAGVEMPISQQVVHVVHDAMAPRDMLANLMSRDIRGEQGSGAT